MTGFELQISGVGSDRSTNSATATAPFINILDHSFAVLSFYLTAQREIFSI